MSKRRIVKIAHKSTKFARQVREKVAGYILAAFGFVAALAWNEAIKELIDHFYPLDANGLVAKFVYAVVVTVVVVVVSLILIKFSKDDEK